MSDQIPFIKEQVAAEYRQRMRVEELEGLLSGWLMCFRRFGPQGSHQFEKFDTIKRETEMALEWETTDDFAKQ